MSQSLFPAERSKSRLLWSVDSDASSCFHILAKGALAGPMAGLLALEAQHHRLPCKLPPGIAPLSGPALIIFGLETGSERFHGPALHPCTTTPQPALYRHVTHVQSKQASPTPLHPRPPSSPLSSLCSYVSSRMPSTVGQGIATSQTEASHM